MVTKRKRAVGEENRKFNAEWRNKNLFKLANSKTICLLCQYSVAQAKEYNIKRHFETNHGEKYSKDTIEEKAQLADRLARNLQAQQQTLIKSSEADVANTALSFQIARILTKHQKPFSDGEMVKECLMTFAQTKCPICEKCCDISNHDSEAEEQPPFDCANIYLKFNP